MYYHTLNLKSFLGVLIPFDHCTLVLQLYNLAMRKDPLYQFLFFKIIFSYNVTVFMIVKLKFLSLYNLCGSDSWQRSHF